MTAKPGNQSVYIRRGDPWEMTLGPSTPAGSDVATVIGDVALILAQVKADSAPATAVTLDLAQNAVLSAGDTVVTLSLTAADTEDLPPGLYVWDFQPNPDEDTWVAGSVTIDADVSRPA